MQSAERTPQDLTRLKGDDDALVQDFFLAYSQDLPEDLARITVACGNDFIRKKLRTNLRQLFQLPLSVAAAVAEGNGIMPEDAPGWLTAWEDAAGMCFRDHSVPESALLYGIQGQTQVGVGLAERAGTKMRKTIRTVGQQLAAENRELVVPEYCYSWIEDTLDPLTTTITEPELEKFSDSVIEFVGTKTGRYNMGRPLCKRMGAAICKRLPLMPKGN